MRNREIFQQIKSYVETQGLTRQQVENATPGQLASVLGVSEAEVSPYFNGIKRLVLEDMQVEQNQQILANVKTQVQGWLDSTFPGHEETMQVIDGKLAVTIWPFGKPESI